MPEFPLDPDLAAVSAALGGLAPAPPKLDRDRLLYEAGRRSVRSRPWPIVAGLFAVLSAGLGARLATVSPRVDVVYLSPPPASRERERPEGSNPPVAYAPGSPADALDSHRSDYLRLRDLVVRFGADSLPAVRSGPAASPQPVEQLLGLPRGTLSDTQKSRWEHQLFRGEV